MIPVQVVICPGCPMLQQRKAGVLEMVSSAYGIVSSSCL